MPSGNGPHPVHVGSTSELSACVFLMRSGYDVFRSLAANTPFDLVAYKDGVLYKVEVKTGRRRKESAVATAQRLAHPAHIWDLLIVVFPDECILFTREETT